MGSFARAISKKISNKKYGVEIKLTAQEQKEATLAAKYPFTMEEFKTAEIITQDQMAKDIKDEGELHKYMIQAMNKPDGLPLWNKNKHEKVQ